MLDTNGLREPLGPDAFSVFLRPGDWLVGSGGHRVSTLLGSCVSVVMWAPGVRVGAMCHCLLPERPTHAHATLARGAGHYVDEALDWMASTLLRHGARLQDVDISVTGGARCADSPIGQANAQAALAWLGTRGVRPGRCETGGRIVRKLYLNLADGDLQIVAGGHLGGKDIT